MLFWILATIAVGAIPALIAWNVWVSSTDRLTRKTKEPLHVVPSMVGVSLFVISMVFTLGAWNNHAQDLAKVTTQNHRIEVQQQRISSLTERLESFNYPKSPTVLLNSDSPIASIVQSITEAEDKLASVRDQHAIAIRSIEARRNGPVGGIVTVLGDGQ